jgi:hypothetical protein
MTYMRSWKSLRLTSHTWLGLNPQIGRPLSRIVVPLFLVTILNNDTTTKVDTNFNVVTTMKPNLQFQQNHGFAEIVNSLTFL